MAEGVAAPGGRVTGGVHDDPDSPPPADATAPKGWTWNRKRRAWDPRQRGPVLWRGEDSGAGRPDEPAGSQAHEPAPEPPQDPDPSYLGQPADSGSSGGGDVPFDEVPQQVKDDIAGLAGLVATPVLAILQQLDPYCGTVLAQNFRPVLDATLPLICRSERIVKYFSEDKADWLLWGKLAMALAPVARAFAEHHIFRTVQVHKDPQTGQVTVTRAARQQDGDHLQPQPQPEYNYAA